VLCSVILMQYIQKDFLSLSLHATYIHTHINKNTVYVCVHVYTSMHTKKTLTEYHRFPLPICYFSSNIIKTLEGSNMIYRMLSEY